jgi:hypothetical protein
MHPVFDVALLKQVILLRAELFLLMQTNVLAVVLVLRVALTMHDIFTLKAMSINVHFASIV